MSQDQPDALGSKPEESAGPAGAPKPQQGQKPQGGQKPKQETQKPKTDADAAPAAETSKSEAKTAKFIAKECTGKPPRGVSCGYRTTNMSEATCPTCKTPLKSVH